MTRQIRDTHREAEHKEKLTCKKCERVFSNLRCLQAHNRAHHKTKEKEVTCLKCGEFVKRFYMISLPKGNSNLGGSLNRNHCGEIIFGMPSKIVLCW